MQQYDIQYIHLNILVGVSWRCPAHIQRTLDVPGLVNPRVTFLQQSEVINEQLTHATVSDTYHLKYNVD